VQDEPARERDEESTEHGITFATDKVPTRAHDPREVRTNRGSRSHRYASVWRFTLRHGLPGPHSPKGQLQLRERPEVMTLDLFHGTQHGPIRVMDGAEICLRYPRNPDDLVHRVAVGHPMDLHDPFSDHRFFDWDGDGFLLADT
jgi:hypothetical protein